jgi:ABC-type transport system involved in multi-copper enzyme maturation permease subunit
MTATLTQTRTPMAASRTFTRPGLVRLTGIELRKMADTRAGFWLMVTTALISVAIVVIQLFAADPPDLNFKNLFQSTLFPVAVLLPVLGILSVTSEWTQRTALTTFALTPQRQRIVIAKAFASVVLGILALVPSLAFAAIGNVIAGGMDGASGSWSFSGLLLAYALLFNVVNVLFGLGFGMLFMNSAVAIVLYFVVPTIWSVLTNMISGLNSTAEWLDLSVTSTPLFEDAALTGGEWAKLAASIGLWVVLPSVLGLVRLLKREVS